MRYMILIHSNEAAEAAWADGLQQSLYATHDAIIADLVASKEFIDTNELDTENVTVIGHHHGQPITTRGPFTEGTEFVGGYYIVDVASHERAVEIAGRFAEAKHSPIEVRRLMHSEEAS
ncbi:YciI family protein [Microcella sp.]|uniref:YciI family protein n=1 Tax=Microcella sp. TaxID=1913979 RepID=UPI00391CF3FF